MTIEQTQMKAGDYTYEVRRAGHGDGVVILLHGFPETSHMWLPLLEHLAANGYTALAPDLRGYSPGATPPEAEHYSHASMAGDILAMADALGKERFHLVGHDHGAGLGWYMAGRHADRLISWTALSVPHIDAFGDAIANNPEQRQRSGYMQFFRQVGTAEAALSANDFAALRNIWSASSPEQVEEYVRVLSQPGAMTGALNWYRGGITPDRRARRQDIRADGADLGQPRFGDRSPRRHRHAAVDGRSLPTGGVGRRALADPGSRSRRAPRDVGAYPAVQRLISRDATRASPTIVSLPAQVRTACPVSRPGSRAGGLSPSSRAVCLRYPPHLRRCRR